jgi:hypothetical protein
MLTKWKNPQGISKNKTLTLMSIPLSKMPTFFSFFFRDTNEYSIDTYQVSRDKNLGKTRGKKKIKIKIIDFFCHVTPLSTSITRIGAPSAPAHAGPYSGNAHGLGPYPTLN